MKARKYEGGGPIGPKGKGASKGASSAYEANRIKKQKEQEENANVVRRQNAINRANRQLANPNAYETSQQRASSPTYKSVSGERVGISSAERAGASQGLVGSRTPESAKRVYKAETATPSNETTAPKPAPARKPGELSEETKKAVASGESRSREIGKSQGEYTMEDAKKRGIKMKYGGMIPRRK